MIQNSTTEIVQTLLKKEQRSMEAYVMMKTLIDEQREMNDAIKEVGTMLKSVLGGQKVHHDFAFKKYELEKNNEFALKQILGFVRDKNRE